MLFPVSALEYDGELSASGFKASLIDVTCINLDEGYDIVSSIGEAVYDSGSFDGVRYKINFNSNLSTSYTYYLGIILKLDDSKVTNDYKLLGSYEIAFQNGAGISMVTTPIAYRSNTMSNYHQNATSIDTFDDGNKCNFRVNYDTQELNTSFDDYYSSVNFKCSNAVKSIYIYLRAVDFELIDSATSEIIENQNENTDKILNGDQDLDSSGETDKVDGALGDIDGATSNAMGGKTDEEVQNEINSALDSDSIGLDFNKANRVSNFFDNCLNSFGTSYKTLLMLSLCLGLSAFLIGRKYG